MAWEMVKMTKNQAQIDEYLEKLLNQRERAIDQIYMDRLKAIREQIAEMYERYAKGETLTYADMVKYNRMRRLEERIKAELRQTYEEIGIVISNSMEEQYLENYFRTAYLLEYETQKKMGFRRFNPEVLEQALNNPIAGLTLKEILEKNRQAITWRIRQEITQGLIAGESYQKMAQRIRSALGGDRSKALTVAWTEAGRAQILGRLEAIEQAEEYIEVERVWDAALDRRTRPAHRVLDGQKADEEGYFHYRGMRAKGPHLWGVARMDIRCRCTVRVQIEGEQPSVRRARRDDGSTEIIPWTNYDDWYKNRIES